MSPRTRALASIWRESSSRVGSGSIATAGLGAGELVLPVPHDRAVDLKDAANAGHRVAHGRLREPAVGRAEGREEADLALLGGGGSRRLMLARGTVRNVGFGGS